MSARKLILIDGNGLLYRAYFAIPALSTSSGRPTNAVFGFIRILRQLRESVKPTHWMVVFDGGISGKHRQLLESYKAQRPPMPEPLREQVQPIEEYLDRALIPRLRVVGEEADDVLATLSQKAKQESEDVLILTNDKDLFQLVDEQIRILFPSDMKREIGVQEVFEKTGVYPAKIIEWLALMGDNSDNIPGVPGVGSKTAARLLEQYETVENIWKNLDIITPERIRTALGEHRDIVLRNIELIRLRCDLDCSLDWQAMAARLEQRERLLPLLQELEFHSLARAMEK